MKSFQYGGKLRAADVLLIKQLIAAGYKPKDLAERFNVTRATISWHTTPKRAARGQGHNESASAFHDARAFTSVHNHADLNTTYDQLKAQSATARERARYRRAELQLNYFNHPYLRGIRRKRTSTQSIKTETP